MSETYITIAIIKYNIYEGFVFILGKKETHTMKYAMLYNKLPAVICVRSFCCTSVCVTHKQNNLFPFCLKKKSAIQQNALLFNTFFAISLVAFLEQSHFKLQRFKFRT